MPPAGPPAPRGGAGAAAEGRRNRPKDGLPCGRPRQSADRQRAEPAVLIRYVKPRVPVRAPKNPAELPPERSPAKLNSL